MTPLIKGYFKDRADADDAVAELKMLGVDDIDTRDELGNTIVSVRFSEVTGVRNVFEKRNAYEILEEMPERE